MNLRMITGYLCIGSGVGVYLSAWYKFIGWSWALLVLPLLLAAWKLLRKDRPYEDSEVNDLGMLDLGHVDVDLDLDFDLGD